MIPTIPTAQEIKSRIVSDLETTLNQSTPLLPHAFNRVLAGALAGFFLLSYQAILWVYAQIFPDRADFDSLVLLGKLVGIAPRRAVAAVLTANVFGDNTATVAEGTRFTGPNGITYEVTTGGVISGGSAACELTAVTKGADGNLDAGVSLTIVSADVELTGLAEVTGTVTTGADEETVASFRRRVVVRYRKRVTGGSPGDYELWGLETPHFVWISPLASNATPGEVIVYGRVDNQADGIPTGAQLTELEWYLIYDPETERRMRKPTTDTLDVRPISRALFDVEIEIQNPTVQLETQIEEAVAEYMESREPFNEGVSEARVDAVTVAGISAVANELAFEAGAAILGVTLTEVATAFEIQNYLLYGGEHAKLQTITFVDVT